MKSGKSLFRLSRSQWISAAVLASSLGLAAAVTIIPNTFTAGSTISASQVNANFAALGTAIDAKTQSGQITITPGHGDLRVFDSTDPSRIIHFPEFTRIINPTINSIAFGYHPSIPTSLYGTALQLNGVEFCYTANAGVDIFLVEINVVRHSTGAAGTFIASQDDTTVRTDSACRLYSLTTPVILTAKDEVNFFFEAGWATPGASLDIGRVTFSLSATSTASAAPI